MREIETIPTCRTLSEGWHMPCSTQEQKGPVKHPTLEGSSLKETDMEFATIIFTSNVLMALVIYFVVAKIWQD